MDNETLLEGFYMKESKLPYTIAMYTENEAKPHWHHFWEIIYQIEGESRVNVATEEFYSHVGDVTIIGGEVVHATKRVTKNQAILVMQFELSALIPYFQSVSEYQYLTNLLFSTLGLKTYFRITKEKDYIQNLLRKAFQEYDKKEIGYEIEIQAYLLQMFAFFLRKEYLTLPKIPEEKRLALSRVRKSIIYIDNHYNEDITLDEIAEVCCMSVYNFCRTFKKATDSTFIEYLNYIRLTEAEKLLLSTDRAIGDIAYTVGFSNYGYFNRTFKRRYGFPPFAYKKQNCALNEQDFE